MNTEQARLNMIEQQIRPWEVLDQDVLDLLNEIHREDFIPDDFKQLAFADISIPIGHDQITMSPKVEARLLQSIGIGPEDSVLEIGTGCGYLTALMAKSAKQVKSIDIYPDIIDRAKTNLDKTGLDNIELECSDVYSLLENSSEYDVVVFTASVPVMDDRFLKLLNDNGRLFVIIGDSPVMEAQIIRKQADAGTAYESLFETDVPALIGSELKDTFSF